MSQEILSQLEPWKRKTFHNTPTEIPLQDVVDSINNGKSIVEIVPNQKKDRWVVFRKDLRKPALMCYAGVWLWGSPFQTGNYVPAGKKKQPDLPLQRIQTTPSHLCEISYTFDTSDDKSLYDYSKVLDKLVEDHAGFIEACEGKEQTTFQNGGDPSKSHRYITTAKVFMYKAPSFRLDHLKYPLHPWIRAAVVDKDVRLAPNKSRPRLLNWTGSRWSTIQDTAQDRFAKDDIIWWAFVVVFTIKAQFWSRDLIPMSLVRVGKLDANSRTLYAPMDTDFEFQELGVGRDDDDAEGDTDGWEDDGLADTISDDMDKKRKREEDVSRDDSADGRTEPSGSPPLGGKGKKRELSMASTEVELSNVERGVSNMDIDDLVFIGETEGDQPPAQTVVQKKRSSRTRRP